MAEDRGWERTYWAFDIHETIIRPNWKVDEIPTTFYPFAKETLQLVSKRTDIIRILYTCSHPQEIEKYLKFFASYDIHFDHVNENPQVGNSGYGCYDKKPYFNVLFEDKCGFDAESDWEAVLEFLKDDKNILAL